jgi:hypothetical protein
MDRAVTLWCRALLGATVTAGLVLAALPLAVTAGSDPPPAASPRGAALQPPAPVAVPESQVASTPYPVALAPDGELRILHFETGLVSSVLVGQPWLVTVVIQGSDVILQARASSGATPVVVYVGAVATLWQVTIGPHGPVSPKITVTAGRPSGPGSGAQAGPAGAQAARPPRLEAFLASLSADQKRLFEAWEREPTAEALSEFLASLRPEQRAEFDALVQAHLIVVRSGPVSAPLPPLVDRTTVLHAGSGAGAEPAAVSVRSAPAGLRVTAQAGHAGEGLVVSYIVENRRDTPVAVSRVLAVDAAGRDLGPTVVGDTRIDPGAAGTGRVTIAHHAGPVTITIEFAGGDRAVIEVGSP